MVGVSDADRWPPLPLDEWEESKQTLHRFAQIAGKVRLQLAPYRNHWWNVTLRVTTRGLTTTPMPTGDGRSVAIDFDFIDHLVIVSTSAGERRSFGPAGLSVAVFHDQLFTALAEVGVKASIVEMPFDLEPAIRFSDDRDHAGYDAVYVERWWSILVQIEQVFDEFRGRFTGKTSPIQLFWHTFDLAVTRFSGRRAPDRPEADRVTREAYSHEVVSFGFWAGDDKVRAPAFYSYTWPDPPNLMQRQLLPEAAFWDDSGGSAMALLMYDDLRQLASPAESLLAFLQSAYDAGATAGGWDMEELAARPAQS
ncbi:MAG: DUF5996 family protein [Thermomicrobiales bacterium]